MTSATVDRPSTPSLDHAQPVTRPAAYGLSVALAVVALAASVPTVLAPGLLHGPAVMVGSARGTALVMAVVAVPLLLVSMLLARRGSRRAVPLWLGAVAYLVYNAVMLLLGTPFNSLFLLYDATLSLGVWSLVAVLVAVDVPALWRDAALRTSVLRTIAVLTWVVVTLNALAWLGGIVPGMARSDAPAFLVGTGLTTLPTYVQDLAIWLPLLAVAAWWLWRGTAWGMTVVSAGLTMLTVEGIGVAVDQTLGHLADPASPVVSPALAPMFLVAAVVTAVPVVVMLRALPARAH